MKNVFILITVTAASCLPLSAQYFAPLSYNTTNHSLVMSSMNGLPPQDAGGNQSIYYNGNLTVSGTISGNFSGNVGGGGGGGGGGPGNYSGNFTGGNISGLLLGNTTVTPQAVGNTSLAPVPFNVLSGNYNTAATDAATYAPRNSPSFTGNGQLSGNLLVGGNVSGTWNGTNLTESQVTNLSSDLSAKAPLASPALTGNPSVAGNLAVSGNSSALNFNGTNAFFTNITAPNLDVTGNFAFGSVNSTIVGNNTASLAINGTFLAGGYGDSLILNNGNDTQQTESMARGNVLTIWNQNADNGNSAFNFRDNNGNSTGALGYGNYPLGSNSYGHRMFFSASQPYDDADNNPDQSYDVRTTPTGMIFAQEAYYNGVHVQRTCMLFDEHWQFSMQLPGGGNWLDAQTPAESGDTTNGASKDIQLNLSGNAAGDTDFDGYNVWLGPNRSGPNVCMDMGDATLHGDYYAFQANGAYWLAQNGATGMSYIIANSTVGNFEWYTGGLYSGNQKMVLTNAGNLAIGTMTPATGALLTVAGNAAMSGNITLDGNITDTSGAGYPQGILVTSSNASGAPFFSAQASSGKAFDMQMPTISGNAVAMFISNTTQQQFISDADGSSINFLVGDTYQNDTLQVNGANIAVTGNASVSGNITTAAGPPFAIIGNNTTTLFITINGIARNITFAP